MPDDRPESPGLGTLFPGTMILAWRCLAPGCKWTWWAPQADRAERRHGAHARHVDAAHPDAAPQGSLFHQ